MTIEKLRLADLKPAEYNPRKDLKPGDPEYEKLKRSIEQFGYVDLLIWNKTTEHIVGGHQRAKVLMDLGYDEVDCVVVEMDETACASISAVPLGLSTFLRWCVSMISTSKLEPSVEEAS